MDEQQKGSEASVPSGGALALPSRAPPPAPHMIARRAWAERMIMSKPSNYFPLAAGPPSHRESDSRGGIRSRPSDGMDRDIRARVEGAVQAQ